MLRYLAQFILGTLTFAVGVFFVEMFSFQPAPLPVIYSSHHNEEKSQALTESTFYKKRNLYLPVSKRFTCEDKSIQPFWEKLKKHKNFKNAEKFYKQVDLEKSNKNYDCAYFFRVKDRVDLNADGEPEVLIQGINTGFCEMTGDCENYVFTKRNGVYKQILFESYAIEYKINRSQTNGYFDIEFKDNDRLGDNAIRIYRFDGRKYRVKECYRSTWLKLHNGEEVIFNPPKIAREKCFY
jgi:hypothetical protein